MNDAPDAAAGLVVRGVGALAADAVAQAAELLAALARGLAEPHGRAAQIHARASGAFGRRRARVHAGAARAGSRGRGPGAEPGAVRSGRGSARDLARRRASSWSSRRGSRPSPLAQRRADLCGIAQLAAGACDTAALLVRANAVIPQDDERRDRAEQISAAARAAALRLRRAARADLDPRREHIPPSGGGSPPGTRIAAYAAAGCSRASSTFSVRPASSLPVSASTASSARSRGRRRDRRCGACARAGARCRWR